MITLEECKKALENARERRFQLECANDMDSSPPQHREDKQEIEYWEKLIVDNAKNS